MGNSSSHSFSKSRSTSLTDLPYKIGNTSYTGSSKHGLRASAVISSTSQLPHRPTSYKDDSLAPKRALSFASPDRTATLPGTKREPAGRQGLTRISSEVQTTQRQSSLIQPGPKQYNDAYLQSDVKRLFKAHDKSGSKASTVEEDDTSTEALDKKLATLKKQRGKGELTETLSTNIPPPKKSRKTRKAPGMPPSERNDDKNLISTSAGNKQLTKNTKISNRKSTPAPLPPSKVDTPPASKKEQTSDEPIQLPVAAPTLSVQQANSAELLKNVDKDDTDAEKSTVNALPEMSILQEPKVVVCSTPQSKGNQADLVEKAAEDSNETKASATLIEREVTPFKERVPLEDSSTNQQISEGKSATQKDVAIQYNTPVDMAIQCTGQTLKIQKEKAEKEQLTNILQRIIRENSLSSTEQTSAIEQKPEDETSANDNGSSTESPKPYEGLTSKTNILLNKEIKENSSPENVEISKALKEEVHNKDSVEEVVATTIATAELRQEEPENNKENEINLTAAEPAISIKMEDSFQKESENAPSVEKTLDTLNSKPEVDEPTTSKEVINDASVNAVNAELEPTGLIEGKLEIKTSLESQVESKESASPASSKDSGTDEPSDLSISPPGEAVNATFNDFDVEPIFPVSPISPISPFKKLEMPSSVKPIEDEPKKQKNKSSFFKITKTMRSFMSSIGRSSSPKSSKQEEPEPESEPEPTGVIYSANNWSFSESAKKTIQRKEYIPKPTTSINEADKKEDSRTEEASSELTDANIKTDNNSSVDVGISDKVENTAEVNLENSLAKPVDQVHEQQESITPMTSSNEQDKVADKVAAFLDTGSSDSESGQLAEVCITQQTKACENQPSAVNDSLQLAQDNEVGLSAVNDSLQLAQDNEVGLSAVNDSSAEDVIATESAALDTSCISVTDGPQGSEVPNPTHSNNTDQPDMSSNDQLMVSKTEINGNLVESEDNSRVIDTKKRTSALELMAPKGYGASSSVYRPVSKPWITKPSS